LTSPSEHTHQQFVCIAWLLFEKALLCEMPEEIENYLLTATDITVHLHGKKSGRDKDSVAGTSLGRLYAKISHTKRYNLLTGI